MLFIDQYLNFLYISKKLPVLNGIQLFIISWFIMHKLEAIMCIYSICKYKCNIYIRLCYMDKYKIFHTCGQDREVWIFPEKCAHLTNKVGLKWSSFWPGQMYIQKGLMCASNPIGPAGALSAYFQRHDKHHFGVHKMDGALASVRFMFFLLKLHYRLGEREHLVLRLTFFRPSYLKHHCVSSMMTYQLSMSICCLTRSEKSTG